MPTYDIDGETFEARDLIDGVLIDPVLPELFDVTDNAERPESQKKWWLRPYVCSQSVEQLDAWYASRTDEHAEAQRENWKLKNRDGWLESWPTGVRYDVRCLDGGAWDRSSSWGMFGDQAAAIECALGGPKWRQKAEQDLSPEIAEILLAKPLAFRDS